MDGYIILHQEQIHKIIILFSLYINKYFVCCIDEKKKDFFSKTWKEKNISDGTITKRYAFRGYYVE